MIFDKIEGIAKKVAVIACVVLVLFLICAETGLSSQPMTENVYDVVDYEKIDSGYSVVYKDKEGVEKTIVCKTAVEGDEKEVRISEREYWGFSEKEGTLILTN